MLKNYFKTAVQVLWKNRLYTGISLFGISFTLMVLMLAAAILENELGNNPPLSNGDRVLFIPTILGEGFAREEVVTYDSTMVDGRLRVDTLKTTRIVEGKVQATSSSGLGLTLFKEKISAMKTPETASVFVDYMRVNVYPNDLKMALNGNMTDENYWKIFDFEFLEGAPFSKEAVASQSAHIIVRESTAEKYFGKSDSYLGKEIVWGQKTPFKVTGVVKDASSTNRSLKADFFIPLSWANPDLLNNPNLPYSGYCVAALLAKNAGSVKEMEKELRIVESGLEKHGEYDRFRLLEKDVSDVYAWNFIGSQLKREGKNFILIVLSVMALFLLISAINLINLNVTRMYERASEIGVRKAFGAKTTDLLVQFLFENLLITFLGGLVGICLTLLLIGIFNSSEVFGNARLSFNISLFFVTALITFVFGILSGLIPAWRISGTQVAEALKSAKQ